MRARGVIGLVAAGYCGALLAAGVAAYLRAQWAAQVDPDASGGMAAFGNLLFFIAVFGVAATLPTGFGLYCLRPVAQFMALAALFAPPSAARRVLTVAAAVEAAVAMGCVLYWVALSRAVGGLRRPALRG